MGIGAATVTFDTNIEDATLTRTIRGTEIVRMAIVQGLDAEVNEGHALLGLAIDATEIRVGVDFHPTRTDLMCTRIDARHMPDSPSKAEITVTYGIPVFDPTTVEPGDAPPQIEGNAVVQSVVTSKDIYGNPILLEHSLLARDEFGNRVPEPKKIRDPDDPEGGIIDNPRHGQWVLRHLKSTAKVEVMRPMYTFSLSQPERDSPADKRSYIGTVNHKSWFGFDPGTIMCTGIPFRSFNVAVSFQTTYNFQENVEGWVADVGIIDPETGEFAVGIAAVGMPLEDHLDEGNRVGRVLATVYRMRDFNRLRLDDRLSIVRPLGGILPPRGG